MQDNLIQNTNQLPQNTASQSIAPQRLPFTFTGDGGEYFRIWIVNLVLIILTLGIYSAWAKVRRVQYFYRNTWLNDANFDYHGNPISILKGRVIAFALFAGYNVSLKANIVWGLVFVGLLALIFPFLILKSLRFRAVNTSYRGLHFGFDGTVGQAYKTFLGWGALAWVTFSLTVPMMHKKIKAFQHNNSRYGRTNFSFSGKISDFYNVYGMLFLMYMGISFLIIILMLIAVAVSEGLATALSSNAFSHLSDASPALLGLAFFAFYLGIAFFMSAFFLGRIQNLVWNNTRLGINQFHSNLRISGLFKVMMTNFLGIIFTLGLYKPFADIRLCKYRLAHMALIANGDLEAFIAGEQQQVAAFGGEAIEVFDFDLSL